jgi:hypothetical protein
MAPAKINYALYGIDRYINKERLLPNFNYEEYLKNNGAHADVMKLIGAASNIKKEPKNDMFAPSRSHSRSRSRSIISERHSVENNNFASSPRPQSSRESRPSNSGVESSRSQSSSAESGSSGRSEKKNAHYKIQSQSGESSETKKMNDLLARILRLETRGIVIPNELIDPKNMEKLNMIVTKHEIAEKIRVKIATASSFLKGFTWGIEKFAMLMKVSAMEGWSEAVMADQSSYNEVLEQLYDKYLTDVTSPEMKLMFLLAQSAIMHTSGMTIIRLMSDLNRANQRDTVNRMNDRFSKRKMRTPKDDEVDDDDILNEVEEYSRSRSSKLD